MFVKYIKLILVFLLIQNVAFSQKKIFENEHYLGLKFGLNMNFIVNDGGILDLPNNYGLNFGIVYKNFLERNAGTYLGINYVQKGGYGYFLYDENEERVDSLAVRFHHLLEYIELPILMNIRFGKKHSRLNLYLGPGISYLFRQKISYIDETEGRTFTNGTDKNFEFAINGGGGYSFNFNKGEIELSFMYTHGLTNVFKPLTINNTLYNQTQMMTASLSYYFKI